MRDGDNRKEKLLYAVRIRNEAKKREKETQLGNEERRRELRDE